MRPYPHASLIDSCMHRRSALLISALLIVGCFVAQAVPAARALAVSPVLYDFEIAPGSSKQGVITLVNDTDEEDTYALQVRNFVAMGEDGAQEYLDEEAPSGLASWIALDKQSVTLDAAQSGQFNFSVNVPANAEPGGHYASIFFTHAGRPGAGTGVGIGGQVGVLILVNVPGDVREEASVESFTLQGSGVRSHLPVVFDLRLQNKGSVHFRPRGTLTIKNLFGQTVARESANPKNSAVLPNSVRRVEMTWARTLNVEPGNGFWSGVRNEWKNFAIGRYRASVEVTYGSQGSKLSSPEVAFWVVPWRLLLLGIGGLVIIVMLVRLYNRVLVRSALKKEARSRRKSQ
jgi:hypothetical protein